LTNRRVDAAAKHKHRVDAAAKRAILLECYLKGGHNGSGKDVPVDENHTARHKRWFVAGFKLLIVVLVVWFVRRTIVDAWQQLGEYRWQCDFRWLAVSGGLYLLGTLPCALFWLLTLRVLGQPVGLLQTMRAYYVGHLGKYVPGKAMVVVLRAALVRGPGVDAALVVASVFWETLTMMSTGALMAAAIVAFWFREETLLFWAAVAMMVAAGAPTLPPVFRSIVRLAGVGRMKPETVQKLARLGYGTMLLGWLLTGAGWIMLGLSLWAALRALGAAGSDPLAELPTYTAAVGLATVAGFVSLIPGGAVVREAVLTRLMAPHLGVTGDAVALIGAILLRLVWVVSELVISGILYLGIRGSGRGDSQSPPGA
jgi:glycosyltransferase 2 family protein